MVILGNTQKEGVDFQETFVLVVKMVTVRTLLSVASARSWPVHQMDITTLSFMVICWKKSTCVHSLVFGPLIHNNVLVKEAHIWTPVLVLQTHCGSPKFCFTQSYADYSLFTYHVGDTFLCVLIYVDDLLITSNSLSEVNKFKISLSSTFHVKELGVLKYFLGIEAPGFHGNFFMPTEYALEIISDAGLFGTKSISLPMEPNHQLAKSTSALFHLPDRYWRLIGKLIYLTLTRLKLVHVVHTIAHIASD